MTASLIIPLAVLASLVIGAGLIVLAIAGTVRNAEQQSRWPILAAFIGALVVNSWWLALLAMVFIKFVILREDT
jgi:hypothetical protein